MKNYWYTPLIVVMMLFASMQYNVFAEAVSDHLKVSKQTYVRCWYRVSSSHDHPQTDWVWARNTDGSFYRLEGYWYSDQLLSNMFFTETPQSEIYNHCEATLKTDNRNLDDIIFFAAENYFSFNYTIWSNDQNDGEEGINKIISFGDSLSDKGNIFNGSQWTFPNLDTWFLGHFSNGFLWTEYLAKYKKVPLYNWAIGVSAGVDELVFLQGVVNQVKSYIKYMEQAKFYNPENTLFTVEFGLNDFMIFKRSVDEVKLDLEAVLETLVSANAKNIVLMILPDATHTPGFKYKSHEEIEEVRHKIMAFNDHIREKIRLYQEKNINVIAFDVYHLLEVLIESPEVYGFENATDACLDINRNDILDYFSCHNMTHDCQIKGSDKYVFWGITHPTTKAHEYFATHLYNNSIQSFIFKSNKSKD